MIKFFKNFRDDESGAVTVDWVVLCAAVAALAGGVYTTMQTGVSGAATDAGSVISNTVKGLDTTTP